MELVGQYQGNYITAESASKYIDISTIVAGCNNLISAAEGFKNVGNKICNAGDICNAQVLSVDGESMTSYIYEQGNEVSNSNTAIVNLANEVMENAYNAYNRVQNELNQTAYNRECEYVNELNSKNS